MIKKLLMMFVATMATMLLPQVGKAEMQIGLANNYAYSEGSVKIDGRDWHYVEMEDYVSHIHIGYDVVPWVFEYGVDQHDNICIPVTGCGHEKIVPVITLGTAMTADRIKASVLTDAEFASKFHLGEFEFEIDEDDDELEYESVSKRLMIGFPRSVWPDGKVLDNRQWILVSLANVRIGQNGFFSPKTFTVGIKGTDLVTPTITIRPDDMLPETTKFTPSNVFGLGVTMYSPALGGRSFDPFFGLWDGVGVGDGVGRIPYRLETDEEDGKFGNLTFSVPSSGELYIKIETMYDSSSSWDFEVDDLQISGSAYGGTLRTIGSPDRMNEPFWIVLDAKKAGSLTIGNYGGEIIANGIWFRPSSVNETECLATEAWYREEITTADDVRMANFRGFVTGVGVVPFGQKAKLICYPNEDEELDRWEFINCTKPEDATVYSQTLSFTVTKALYDQIEAEDESIKRVIVRPVFRTLPDYEPKSDTPVISAIVADGCEAMGKVTGGKTAKAGTKVTLKATANKGYVFAGWEGPLDESQDPRNPSASYVVEPADVEFVAKFISLADDVAAISFTMPKEYENGVAIDNVAIDVSGCTSLPKVSVKGLPAGLKFTAKPIYKKGSKTEIEVPANTIYGTSTKSGVYTVVATVTTAGKKTAICSQTIIVRKSGEKVVVAECNANGGKVTGGGVYVAGKKVALKATANKGFVFAGWYEDASFATPCDSSFVDYRTASYAYTMGNEDKTFYARFIPAVEDSLLDLTVNGKTVPTTFTISEYAQLKFDVDSLSLPKISVKGLPAGMKFTAKPIYKKGSKTEIEVPANTIYGAPTKPGNAEIQVSLSNQSIKKAIVKKFIIEVPNLTGANDYFVEDLDNGIEKKRVLSVGISNIGDFLPSLELVSPTAKLAVKGLPSGLKYNAKTGEITGIATKVGTYTVTLTVTDGKAKYVSTITIEVEALPDWVVGTFNGYIDGSESYAGDWVDWVTITITSSGKVSYKDITEDGSIYIVNPKDITFKQNESGDYIIETDQRGIDWYDKKELRISFLIIDGVTVGVIEGESNGADIEDGGAWIEPSIGEFYAIKNVWKNAKGTKLAPTFIKNTITSVSMSRMRDDDWDPYYGGYLTLKYGANGAVTTSYSETEGGKATATGSTQLVPYEVDGNITKAWLYTALKPKGRDAFGVLLFLSFDTSNGNVYGDDVMVEDYLLEVDE